MQEILWPPAFRTRTSVFLVLDRGELVTHRALVCARAIRLQTTEKSEINSGHEEGARRGTPISVHCNRRYLVGCHLQTEAALHVNRVLGLRNAMLHFRTTRDEYPAHFGESSACSRVPSIMRSDSCIDNP